MVMSTRPDSAMLAPWAVLDSKPYLPPAYSSYAWSKTLLVEYRCRLVGYQLAGVVVGGRHLYQTGSVSYRNSSGLQATTSHQVLDRPPFFPPFPPASSAMPNCPKCEKPVYFAERKTSLGKDWHAACLRCEKCNKTLVPGSHSEHDGKPYCNKPCYAALFGPGGFGRGGAESYLYK